MDSPSKKEIRTKVKDSVSQTMEQLHIEKASKKTKKLIKKTSNKLTDAIQKELKKIEKKAKKEAKKVDKIKPKKSEKARGNKKSAEVAIQEETKLAS
jgi:hypothetical protein